jgi:hypothetical protein
MSAFQYLSVNLFVRGVPSIMEQEDLAKVLEVYGEMNMKPEAFSVKFRRINYDEPNLPQYDDLRYNVVLYGFRVNTGPTACFGHMFSSIIQMKRQVRHAWIDSEGKSQYVFITENNRQIPQNFLDELLWKTTNEETIHCVQPLVTNIPLHSAELHSQDGLDAANNFDRLITRKMRLERKASGKELNEAEKFGLSMQRKYEQEERNYYNHNDATENTTSTLQAVKELSDAEKYDRSIGRMMSSTQWLKSKTVQSEEQRQADQAAQDAQRAYLADWAGRKDLSSLMSELQY